MGRSTKPYTEDELLDRCADAAWRYCQSHRAAINEKAKIRMRSRRDALKRAPSTIQLEYAMGKSPKTPLASTLATKNPPAKASVQTITKAPHPRAPGSPTPLLLTDITAGDDDDEERDAESQPDNSDEDGWQGDSEREVPQRRQQLIGWDSLRLKSVQLRLRVTFFVGESVGSLAMSGIKAIRPHYDPLKTVTNHTMPLSSSRQALRNNTVDFSH
ncbi:hypothetical protein C8R45DRAFT_929929 [Mycena sanguinolenta]|nr:hypothetical protein C8R45DRAFT_929929 [Mycena sanguinolenta]